MACWQVNKHWCTWYTQSNPMNSYTMINEIEALTKKTFFVKKQDTETPRVLVMLACSSEILGQPSYNTFDCQPFPWKKLLDQTSPSSAKRSTCQHHIGVAASYSKQWKPRLKKLDYLNNDSSSSLCNSLSRLLAYTVTTMVVATVTQNPRTLRMICGADRDRFSCEASAKVRINIPLQQ